MDPLDLAITRGRLQQITEEMDLIFTKAAFSPIISEMNDRANSMIDPVRMEVVTQGKTGLPLFISSMQASARSIVAILGAELKDGDVVVMNDPYQGGTHLPDIKLLRPFFVAGELILFLINCGHYVDMGGASAGGFDPGTTNIFQEGLQIPPTFLCRAGELRRDVLRLIVHNTRLPEFQEGDLHAQMNALDIGVKRLAALVAERGVMQLRETVKELGNRAEAQMRSYLSRVPSGTYRARDVVEVSEAEELTIQVALTFSDGSVEVDFTGSSPSYSGPMNLAWPTVETAVFLAFKHFFPEVPINGGCFRPVSFRYSRGSFLAAESPSAVGGCTQSAEVIVSTVFAALAQALPERAYGDAFGIGVLSVSGYNLDGTFFANAFPVCGGYGGSLGSDGLVHGTPTIAMALFPKLESSEHDYPIRWEAMELRPDSAGAGRWRGGAGTIFRLRALAPMMVSYMGDRARHAPFGVVGGGSAALTEVVINKKNGSIGGAGTSHINGVRIEAGDQVEIKTNGGGGYGLSAERDQAAKLADVMDGIVSAS